MKKKESKINAEGYSTLRGFHTLKNQITITFISLLLLSILSIIMINRFFLERYYISRKTDVLIETMLMLYHMDYSDVISYEEDEDKEDEVRNDFSNPIRQGSSRQNLNWVIMDPDGEVQMCYPGNDTLLKSKIFGYAYGVDLDRDNSSVIKREKSYVVQTVHDRFAKMKYLECWGQFPNSWYFLIRTPLESIQESVSISNTFYMIVGGFIIAISGVMIWLVTKKITKPISELTLQSQKMSDLDFDVHYTSHAGNEIDVLGECFNHMSDELKKTISELKSANLQLTRDIADRIKIDEMRREFLDNVSHELKTPIALIHGYAEGLLEGISEDPESREFYCRVIMEESEKMDKLVKSLLSLNRLEYGNDVPVMERFDLTELIQGVIANMEIMISQKEVSLKWDGEKPVYVWADAFKVQEVLTNYMSNALHHVEGEKRIEIRLQEQENRVKVSVFNTGQPIPEEALPNLWTKFYRVDQARTRHYGGSGIGLSIVKAIMEGMQQEYGVVNHEDGVEFWFTLDSKSSGNNQEPAPVPLS